MRRPRPLRLSCPACLGVALESSAVADGVAVSHCGRCGGSWLLRGQIPRLRAVPAAAVRAMIRRGDDGGFLCHDCHAPMDRDGASCASCGWKNALECPDCGKAMRRTADRGVTVDVCRGCEAVWLDHHELSALWAGAATLAVAQTSGLDTVAGVADAGGFLLDVLFYAPDVAVAAARGAGYVAEAGMHVAANVPEVLSAAPGALSFIGTAADAAGSVFGVIADVIGGIFDGLG